MIALLTARANARGLVLANEATMLDELGIDLALLRELLEEATRHGAIDILSPLPFLVAKLPGSWSGRKHEAPKEPAKSGAPANPAYSSQSSLSQSKPLMKESYRPPADQEALLREILTTLGETDPTTFRGAVEYYAPAVIRKALDRVRRMHSVRKNRTALFRFLLPRIAKEPPSAN
ncbi:MAG: hypothetical protein IT347_02265 [Candidatus Eisenbacteria bacterium]|nr:hypothetical protein [Candidatus Eisenbacteria bacterium]